MSQTVIGIFENSTEAQEAKSHLLSKGFSNDNIDVNSAGSGYGSTSTADDDEEGFGDRVSKFFKNLFSNDDDVESHVSAARKGTIVTVHAQTSSEAAEAAEVLNNYGAVDVNDYNARSAGNTGSSYTSSQTPLAGDYAGTSYTSDDADTAFTSGNAGNAGNTYTSGNAGTSFTSDDADASDKIKVIKEGIEVGKREVETGGVRLRSRIVERPVEESIRLREERVNVERNTVDRPATEADFNEFKEGTVELTEYAERPVVSKTARVVEEVSLEKEVTEREETISDTVRHTEVETEKIPGSEKKYDSDNL